MVSLQWRQGEAAKSAVASSRRSRRSHQSSSIWRARREHVLRTRKALPPAVAWCGLKWKWSARAYCSAMLRILLVCETAPFCIWRHRREHFLATPSAWSGHMQGLNRWTATLPSKRCVRRLKAHIVDAHGKIACARRTGSSR